jgi:hypothetical protein
MIIELISVSEELEKMVMKFGCSLFVANERSSGYVPLIKHRELTGCDSTVNRQSESSELEKRQKKPVIYSSGHRRTSQRTAAEACDKAAQLAWPQHASVGIVFVSVIAKLLVHNV